MKQKILKTIITGLLFLFLLAKTVFSQSVASGSSAQLVNNLKIEENKKIEYTIKEIVIRRILEKYNSPLVGEEKSFVSTCYKYSLDCYLLPSIAGLESTFGRFILPNSYNPFGWGGGYIIFDSWQDGIETVASGLKNHYINKGAIDIYQIGPIYSESPTWAIRVNWFLNQFKQEEEKIKLLFTEFPVKL